MHELVLVKHSLPEVEPDKPAPAWRLSETGRRRAELLAARLDGFSPTVIWSSEEPKAVETAEIVSGGLGVPVRMADGLEEHDRGDVRFFPTQEEFEAAVEGFFCKPDELVFGSETAEEALSRFSAAINRVIEGEQADTVVVTHGTVMTLYVARVADVRHMSFWRRLGLPSYVVLALPEMQVSEVVESVDSE